MNVNPAGAGRRHLRRRRGSRTFAQGFVFE
jgi:hypothetical protein